MTDGELVAALDSGEISITPIGSRATQIQPCSIDLRLSREVMKYTYRERESDDSVFKHPQRAVRLGSPQTSDMAPVQVSGAAPFFVLDPGEFALGVTIERVKLPAHILGRVEGRSSIGRTGLFVHITAGFIDPGFDGRITLEFYNGAPRPIEIPFGFRVCQLALQRLALPCVRPYGAARGSKYVGETSDGVQPACAEQPAEPNPWHGGLVHPKKEE
jgi:dCTP deaminase